MEAATEFEMEEAKRFLAGLPEDQGEERSVGKYGGRFVESADLSNYDGSVEEARLVNALKELGVEAQTHEELMAFVSEVIQETENRTAQKLNLVRELEIEAAVYESLIADNNDSIRASKAKANAAFGLPHMIFLGVVLLVVGALFFSMTNKREPSQAELACEGLSGQVSVGGQNCKF